MISSNFSQICSFQTEDHNNMYTLYAFACIFTFYCQPLKCFKFPQTQHVQTITNNSKGNMYNRNSLNFNLLRFARKSSTIQCQHLIHCYSWLILYLLCKHIVYLSWRSWWADIISVILQLTIYYVYNIFCNGRRRKSLFLYFCGPHCR